MFGFLQALQRSQVTNDTSEHPLQVYITKGSWLHGNLSVQGTARIHGYVEGDIHAKGTVHIGQDAVIVANIHAGHLIAQGPIRGDVVAKQKVQLLAPMALQGSICTPVLTLEEGVKIAGNLNMLDTESGNIP